jgi:SAM-dependent methyltransferase
MIATTFQPTIADTRTPEPAEAMTPAESAALAGWQASPTGRALYAALATHALERLRPAAGARILCVGEGEGTLAAQLAARLPSAHVVGTDVCPDAVRAARERHQASNLRFEVASAYDLAAFAGVDAVVCVFALHHFADPAAALRQLGQVLAPDGRGYLMDLRRDADLDAYRRRLAAYQQEAPVVAHLFAMSVDAAHTRPELAALLEGARLAGVVEQVALGALARAAFEAEDPAAEHTLPEVLADVDGLWQESVFTRRG